MPSSIDEKCYSLNDIFSILGESFFILTKTVVLSHDRDGEEKNTPMKLSEYIATTIAWELTSDYSRLACPDFTASKTLVKEAMKANYFEPVAYPKYECAGIVLDPSNSYLRQVEDENKGDEEEEEQG